MKLMVKPSVLNGAIQSSPSKSYSHRALAFGLLADGRSKLQNVLLSGDTLATLRAVQAFGAKASINGDSVIVDGGRLTCPDDVLNLDNSGTTIRIMAGVASLLSCATVLTGDASVRGRPMQPLLDALGELGVTAFSTRSNGMAPLVIKGPNNGSKTHIRGDVSSQFISSLLISSALKDVDTEIVLTSPLKSRPYVEITMGMMRTFGGSVEMTKTGLNVPGKQRYKPQTYKVPGDYSSAAFPLTAGALTDSVTVAGLDPEDKQGDKAILDILEAFGARVKRGNSSARAEPGNLEGQRVDLANAPDLFPIVAVLGSQARGTTEIFNAEHVRLKESDRIRSTTDFLKAMGAKIEERKDGCVIRGPTPLVGTKVDSLDDHRILMAAAVAALVADGTTTISHGDCYKVSYPFFVDDMKALGADMELVP
jgi:3-phosphoshikimate 1-carboxyvinyltransferase